MPTTCVYMQEGIYQAVMRYANGEGKSVAQAIRDLTERALILDVSMKRADNIEGEKKK